MFALSVNHFLCEAPIPTQRTCVCARAPRACGCACACVHVHIIVYLCVSVSVSKFADQINILITVCFLFRHFSDKRKKRQTLEHLTNFHFPQ